MLIDKHEISSSRANVMVIFLSWFWYPLYIINSFVRMSKEIVSKLKLRDTICWRRHSVYNMTRESVSLTE